MITLKKTVLILCCVFLLAGCYEDETEITLKVDGSGTVKQKLVISERLIVATSEEDGNKNTPPVSKETLLKQVASSVDITSMTMTELPDGGRIIEFEGTFSSPEQFFLSDFCRDTLKLRLAPAGDGKTAIYWNSKQSEANTGGPSITQLYGLAKGLYIKRIVHLPTEIEKTNGSIGDDQKTITWVTDLRDREGLARTKAFEEGEDKGIGSAVFDASLLTFSLPLKVAAPVVERAETEEKQSSGEGLKAVVAWAAVNKKVSLENDARETEISDLELGINVTWLKENTPYACHTPVLTSIQDGVGNDLVKSGLERAYQIPNSFTETTLKIKADTPGYNAGKIKNIEGYVPVVTTVEKKTIVLDNIQELAGKETTGNDVLDNLHFKIKSISGSRLTIEINGGHNTITSIEFLKKDGRKIKYSGGSGWDNNYSYDFAEDISKLDQCELEVIASQTIVEVPFSLNEIVLP